MITSKADVSCTPIGPPLLKSRPPLQTQASNTANIRVPDRDFGKRNMPGKRAGRHFSQLSEFEKGLIIGMKTAGWSTRRVAGQMDRSECAVRNYWEQWT
ncbi:transposable element Tcb2 transposase [Trichonephila clavipes]|nr:transposable element Tcb2 transposase [Trichonephila clavipes]